MKARITNECKNTRTRYMKQRNKEQEAMPFCSELKATFIHQLYTKRSLHFVRGECYHARSAGQEACANPSEQQHLRTVPPRNIMLCTQSLAHEPQQLYVYVPVQLVTMCVLPFRLFGLWAWRTKNKTK